MYIQYVMFLYRFGCLGWLSYTENAHGDGYDKVGTGYLLVWSSFIYSTVYV